MGQTAVVSEGAAPVVRVSGFRKSYGKQPAVRGVDLEVRAGEVYGLIGPDGAGKSSLIKSIAGVLAYDEGTVEVFGQRIVSERAAERVKGRIGLMPQGLGQNLYAELSIEENVDFFARLRLVSSADLARRKEELLRITRLDRFRNRPMKQLSGGMKQKLGLVCTLIHEPQLILLDEPTTGVDPVSRRDFWSILTQLVNDKSMTVVVSTAYMDEAAYFDRLALLMDGRVVSRGQERDVAALVPGTVLSIRAADQLRALTCLRTVFRQAAAVGPEIRVFVERAAADEAKRRVATALGNIAFDAVSCSGPDLEDVLVALLLRDASTASAAKDPRVTRSAAALDNLPHDGASGDKPQLTGNTAAERAAADGVAIEANGLVRTFGTFRAVDGVSFRVRQGEIFGLLGANGAGKTTVIKMLTGLLPPTAGVGVVAGADMASAADSIKQRIGYMSQVFSLYLDLTVVENITLYAGVYGLSRRESRERLRWVIEMAGLAGCEHRRTKGLPMGLRQRLALGCALVHHPRVLFLDEPTSGVDPLGRRRFWETLVQLSREQGVAILVTTHYMSEAEHCDKLALMHAGRIAAAGSPAEMRLGLEREAGRPLVIETDRPLTALGAVRGAGFPSAALFGRHIHLLSRNGGGDTDHIRHTLIDADVQVLSIERRPLTMEDVFVHHVLALEGQERERATGAGGRT